MVHSNSSEDRRSKKDNTSSEAHQQQQYRYGASTSTVQSGATYHTQMQQTTYPAQQHVQHQQKIQQRDGARLVTTSTSAYPSASQQFTMSTGSPTTTSSPTYKYAATSAHESSRMISANSTILQERIIEKEIKVPKKVVREDIVEKVVVLPEKITREEYVEEVFQVKEKVIEVAKPIIEERIVEVPEYEYIETEVEVPEVIIQEKIREVPVVRYEERTVHVPKIVTKEKIVEVPEVEYREVPVEKVVEVPEIREQVVVTEVPVPQYVERPVPEPYTVTVNQDITHKVPVPLESVSTFAYKLPKLQPKYMSVDMTLYVPRFIEVPVPAEFMDNEARMKAQAFASQVNTFAQQKAVSLCEVETLASNLKAADFAGVLNGQMDYSSALTSAWNENKLRTSASGARQQGHSTTTTTHYQQTQQQQPLMGGYQMSQYQQTQYQAPVMQTSMSSTTRPVMSHAGSTRSIPSIHHQSMSYVAGQNVGLRPSHVGSAQRVTQAYTTS